MYLDQETLCQVETYFLRGLEDSSLLSCSPESLGKREITYIETKRERERETEEKEKDQGFHLK